MDGPDALGALPALAYTVADVAGVPRLRVVAGGLFAGWPGPAPADAESLLAAVAEADRAALFRPTAAAGVLVRLRDGEAAWRACKLRVAAAPAADGTSALAGLITEDADLAAAQEAAGRFEAYARLSADWYWEQDDQFRFTFFSREFEAVTGMPAARGIGRTRWESLREGELGDVDWAAHIRAVEAHEAFRDFEYPSRRVDGHIVWFRVSGQPRFDRDGRFAGYFGVASEISAAKRLEGRLVQAERLSSLGRLAAGVAHEINNPLGFVQSNLATLGNYFATLAALLQRCESLAAAGGDVAGLAALDAEKRAADLAFLLDDAPQLVKESADGLERIRTIVANLREFAREGRPEWEAVDLNACLEHAIELAAAELVPRAAIVRDYAALPPVACMPGVLNLVFLNLLVNAAHAIDEPPGEIRVRTARHGENQVLIEIADNGRGIAPEHLAHIFDPFFTTKPIGRGRGLGLSACFGIVARHHGRIEAHSEPGHGASFSITLPVSQDEVPTSGEPR